MLHLNADINAAVDTAGDDKVNAIQTACIFGNCEMLEFLLKWPGLELNNSGPLVSIIMKNIGEKVKPTRKFEKKL